jgi:hypothetical protein
MYATTVVLISLIKRRWIVTRYFAGHWRIYGAAVAAVVVVYRRRHT